MSCTECVSRRHSLRVLHYSIARLVRLHMCNSESQLCPPCKQAQTRFELQSCVSTLGLHIMVSWVAGIRQAGGSGSNHGLHSESYAHNELSEQS